MEFRVTKRFIAGTLAGMTISEITTVKFLVGKTYGGNGFGSKYIVDSVEELQSIDCDKYYSHG